MHVFTSLARMVEKKPTLSDIENYCAEYMMQCNPDSPEFCATAENLEKVRKAGGYSKHPFLKDVLEVTLPVAGSIVGIVLVIHAEEVQILTSKALQYVLKPKI